MKNCAGVGAVSDLIQEPQGNGGLKYNRAWCKQAKVFFKRNHICTSIPQRATKQKSFIFEIV